LMLPSSFFPDWTCKMVEPIELPVQGRTA
jgi:hypothetical protein